MASSVWLFTVSKNCLLLQKKKKKSCRLKEFFTNKKMLTWLDSMGVLARSRIQNANWTVWLPPLLASLDIFCRLTKRKKAGKRSRFCLDETLWTELLLLITLTFTQRVALAMLERIKLSEPLKSGGLLVLLITKPDAVSSWENGASQTHR